MLAKLLKLFGFCTHEWKQDTLSPVYDFKLYTCTECGATKLVEANGKESIRARR